MTEQLTPQKPSTNKGQVLSIDAAIAVVIFVTYIAAVLIQASGLEQSAINARDTAQMERKAVGVSDLLITSRGKPSYWHVKGSTKYSLGLAWKDHVLSREKLLAIDDFPSYPQLRSMLAVNPYHIRIQLLNATRKDNASRSNKFGGCEIEDSDGQQVNITAGQEPTDTESEVIIDRLVHTQPPNKRRCALRVNIWVNDTL